MITKDVKNMSLNELVNYITKTFHEPLREALIELKKLVPVVVKKYSTKYTEFQYLEELFNQFEKEILGHITKEDFVTFPAIIKFERIYNDNLINVSDNFEIMNELVNNIQMKNQHGNFDSYLNNIIQLIEGSSIKNENFEDFKRLSVIFKTIHDNNILHSRLENHDLYSKGMELQEKLRENLKQVFIDK